MHARSLSHTHTPTYPHTHTYACTHAPIETVLVEMKKGAKNVSKDLDAANKRIDEVGNPYEPRTTDQRPGTTDRGWPNSTFEFRTLRPSRPQGLVTSAPSFDSNSTLAILSLSFVLQNLAKCFPLCAYTLVAGQDLYALCIIYKSSYHKLYFSETTQSKSMALAITPLRCMKILYYM